MPNFPKILRERLQILSRGCFAPSAFRCIPRMQSYLEEPELTEEHIIPESLGGKLVTLSCKSCNSTYGSKLDSHLVQMVRSQDSLAFRSSRYRYAHPATRWCGRGRNILSQEFLGKYSHRIFAGIGHWLKKLHRTLPRLSSKTTVIDQRNLEFLGGHRALGRPLLTLFVGGLGMMGRALQSYRQKTIE